MTDPLVCCVMLTKDRPKMARRAVECFKKQTYRNRFMLILDTGKQLDLSGIEMKDHVYYYDPVLSGLGSDPHTIGALRNVANRCALTPPGERYPDRSANILIHWDDDDFSHPNRIEEQVALLQASGKQAVGYRDMLFWRAGVDKCVCTGSDRASRLIRGAGPPQCMTCGYPVTGEAWLYSNADPRYCLGTSLCYWRETWERRPFPDLSRGEDKAWLREVDSLGTFTIGAYLAAYWGRSTTPSDYEPRMIASVHAGNTSTPDPSTSSNFKRVPEWDSHCRERMAL